jgi:hypothetical protein
VQITITINTDNAAFNGDPAPEVARILYAFAHQLSDGLMNLAPRKLRDINGNTVGQVEVSE